MRRGLIHYDAITMVDVESIRRRSQEQIDPTSLQNQRSKILAIASDRRNILIKALVVGRRATGLSNTEMANRMNISIGNLAVIEAKTHNDLTIAELSRYADAIGLAVNITFDSKSGTPHEEAIVEKVDEYVRGEQGNAI